MDETFTAGVRPGGLTEGREIRILLCHLLSEIDEPMSFDEMTEAIVTEGDANYFEFAHALGELRETGCVISLQTEAGATLFTVTEIGREAGKTLEGGLPLSVKDRVLDNAKHIIKRRRIEKENLVSIEKTHDGYMVHMQVTDIGTNLMELSVFMPTNEQAVLIKKKFLDDPAGTYMGVLEVLAGSI